MKNVNHLKDIHERIYQFVLRVIKMTKFIPSSTQNMILINQIIRSATSMGANDQEADGVDSRKDFIAKYAIVRKEAKETAYWLRLIGETNPVLNNRMKNLNQEVKEIIKIISSIIVNAKKKI